MILGGRDYGEAQGEKVGEVSVTNSVAQWRATQSRPPCGRLDASFVSLFTIVPAEVLWPS